MLSDVEKGETFLALRQGNNLFEDAHDAVIVNLTPDVISTCTTTLEASPVRAMAALPVACVLRWGA
ncbi:MAG TPA: hypothetical protein VLI39_03245 [Sedimentisphaerales bacterium]|nr:hypothetical protein [Sedimentisphaerales bacterium]